MDHDVQERVRTLVEPVLSPLAIDLVDVELVGSGKGRTLRLSIDRDGGIDLEVITEATRAVSPVLDAEDPIPGSYTLEVSSPGVERPLRTAADYRRVEGDTVSVKTRSEVQGGRRHKGTLVAVDDDGVVVEVDGQPRRLAFDDITQARTVFEWGPAPKPGRARAG
ncbi:MAG TPA: ribosome maturation factor RimP [Acidimicrobiia bacterium]|nr:ribosome maturation factor RimP [Acidimicrobiia bacterium]